MSCYFIAQIRITDDRMYQKYIEGTEKVFRKYSGKYLAVDNDPLVLEGNWDYTRTVLIEFKTRDDFDTWYRSDDYQEILAYRLKAAECDSILVKGIEN
jgi:uncharacterized protein (DUF1330 family)